MERHRTRGVRAMIDTKTARAIVDNCARESVEKIEAQRLLDEACRVLASIATFDETEEEFGDCVADAQAFFRLNHLRIYDHLGAPNEAAGEP